MTYLGFGTWLHDSEGEFRRAEVHCGLGAVRKWRQCYDWVSQQISIGRLPRGKAKLKLTKQKPSLMLVWGGECRKFCDLNNDHVLFVLRHDDGMDWILS